MKKTMADLTCLYVPKDAIWRLTEGDFQPLQIYAVGNNFSALGIFKERGLKEFKPRYIAKIVADNSIEVNKYEDISFFINGKSIKYKLTDDALYKIYTSTSIMQLLGCKKTQAWQIKKLLPESVAIKDTFSHYWNANLVLEIEDIRNMGKWDCIRYVLGLRRRAASLEKQIEENATPDLEETASDLQTVE